MNDFDKATKQAKNRFDLVLIASERVRELHAERKRLEEHGELTIEQRRHHQTPAHQAFKEIEDGLVGREYLNRVGSHIRRRRRFDDIT